MRQRRAVVGLVLGIIVLGAAPAQAATFTVNNTTDASGACPTPTTCSLRQAIESTNTAAGSDTIQFSLPPGSVISLTAGTLQVNPVDPSDALAIQGPGAALLTLRLDASAAPAPILALSPAGSGVTLSGFTIADGRGGPASAAAVVSAATLLLDRMRISNNTGDAQGFGAGGGIVVGGFTTILASTFDANKVVNSGIGQSGGAIVNFGGLFVVNSTFTANDVTGTGPDGGAIWNTAGMTLVNTTIAGNSTQAGGGGILNDGQVNISNSILAANASPVGPDCSGTLTSQGYNLLGTNVGCTMVAATGDQIGTMATPINPLLGPLGANGGPTPTMVPLAGSPAIDAGNPAATSDADPPAPPALVACRTTDQRATPRPMGVRCDIGAVEVGADYPAVVLADAPAGYWRFDELSGTTAFDSSGHGNNGSYLNGPLLGQAGAFAGSGTAVSFDGVNDLVRVPDSNSLDVGDTFTLEGWVKRTSTSGSQTLFNKGGNGIQATVMSAANGNQVWLRKANVTTVARSSIGVPADGHFHYIVVTKNGTGAGSVKIYIDNVESTTLLAPAQVIANTAFPLEISGGASSQHVYDEFALYDGVLSAARVAAHFTTAGPALAALLSSQSSGESGTTTAAGTSQASSPNDAWAAAAAAAR